MAAPRAVRRRPSRHGRQRPAQDSELAREVQQAGLAPVRWSGDGDRHDPLALDLLARIGITVGSDAAHPSFTFKGTEFDGPSDALVAVLEDIEKQNVTEIYCLGDVVGYGPNPRECVDLIRR